MEIRIELIEKAKRMPTQKDADPQGCVVTLHEMDGLRIEHYSYVQRFGKYITHWGKIPELRKGRETT